MLELKINELKKEFTEEESEELQKAFLNKIFNIDILAGGNHSDMMNAYAAGKRGNLEPLGYLFGFPYISNSVNDTAAAIWNTNTSADLITGTQKKYKFLGLAVGISGEFVGLFQEYNKEGEEVGEVRCLILDKLAEFTTKTANEEHEKQKRDQLSQINKNNAIICELLPKACAILEKYRGKKWGEATREKIRQELKTLDRDGVRVSFYISYDLELSFYIGASYNNYKCFYFKYDQQNNTPAEEITPTSQQMDMLKPFNVAEHRKNIKKIQNEISNTAEHLKKLLETYREEARGKGYRRADNLSPFGLDLSNLTIKDLDN